jgi:hypothetical protein
MNRQLLVVCLAALSLSHTDRPAAAQDLRGYAFGGIVDPSAIPPHRPLEQLGAVVESLEPNGAGASFEAGMITGPGGRARVTHVSLNVNYHVPRRRSRVEPFVSGGFTVLSGGRRALPALNVGGGVTIWTRRRIGFRVEIRDEVYAAEGPAHILSIRAGMVIRLGRHRI